ncbi:MAG: hypothetical protein OIF57_03075 [Marinobacterium sp.]|nr:hypothetical protein [Marinobacterium sp.]
MYRFSGCVVISALLFSAAAMAAPAEPAPTGSSPVTTSPVAQYLRAYTDKTPISDFIRFVDADDAYAFQARLNQTFVARGASAVGYKLGLTAERRPFAALGPLYARLFDFMQRPDQSDIPVSDFVKPLLELELAFQFKSTLRPPFTEQRLWQAISHVAPAIELADLMFSDPRQLSWQQLVATGIGARRFIMGEWRPVDTVKLDAQQVEARWNNQLYTRGYSRNVMGGQLNALTFLAEQLNRRGQQIQAGEWVMTGAMNRTLPARVGRYRVDFGQLGVLRFNLTTQAQ